MKQFIPIILSFLTFTVHALPENKTHVQHANNSYAPLSQSVFSKRLIKSHEQIITDIPVATNLPKISPNSESAFQNWSGLFCGFLAFELASLGMKEAWGNSNNISTKITRTVIAATIGGIVRCIINESLRK